MGLRNLILIMLHITTNQRYDESITYWYYYKYGFDSLFKI